MGGVMIKAGCIDRLGQEHPEIRIVNLHYQDTVEADVYDALRHRINLLQSFGGRLQPTLARLPQAITQVSLWRPEDRGLAKANLVADTESGLTAAEQAEFELNEVTEEELEEPPGPPAAYGLAELGALLRRLELLPPGVVSKVFGARDWFWLAPGMAGPVRVTTDPDYTQLMPNFLFPHRPVILKFSVSKESKSPWYSPGLLKKPAQALRNPSNDS